MVFVPSSFRRTSLGISVLLSAAAIAPGSASAMVPPKDTSVLSAALARLAKPSVRALPDGAQATALGFARSGPGSLVREGERVLVNVRFGSPTSSGLRALRAIGAVPVSSSETAGTATIAVDPEILDRLAGVPEVASVTASREPILYGSAPVASVAEGPSCEGGSVISEGLAQLKVDQARAAFGLRGGGLTVGVLSDSFDRATTAADGSGSIATHATEDVFSGDLPGPGGNCAGQQVGVAVLDDGAVAGEDEGRAMLQIVHDLAPRASLAFATAFRSEESFAQNIERLAAPVAAGGAGAKVIVDDIAYFEEPFFQDGPVAAAITKVTAEGATYLTSAGNDNLFEGENQIASWEAPAFRDSAGCPAAIQSLAGFNGTHCMDFNPGGGTDQTFGITVAAGATLTADLQWAEPWNGVSTDLDAFLLNAQGKLLTDSAEENTGKNGTQRPVEVVQWENTTSTAQVVQLAINRFSGGAGPRLKFGLLENGSGVTKTEYPKSAGGDIVGPTIFGHAGAPAAIAVAAVPYDDSSEPEPYSSRGPVTHYFGPVAGMTPAAALVSPEVIAKPDVSATDCGATTFFAHRYDGITWRFCGTSAAAPHAAAVAALLRQGDPSASGPEIRTALTETAAAVGSFPVTAVGSGLVDAYAALVSLPGPIVAEEDFEAIAIPPVPQPEGPGTPLPVAPNPAPISTPSPTTPPDTFLTRHPRRLVRTRLSRTRLRFRIASDRQNVEFLCRVDQGRFRRCPALFAHRFAVGAHAFRAKARDVDGIVDPSPVQFRFRVEQIR